ncbi:hypothetical protein P700755_002282 [Psychroflexus torquis ATCC 700755]|uniref:Uncharacterized protein n=1 Tax=Psychroflexus torquis (strain ATCC 700755 / CIP 106069 / ACAM 623) TaxID=313595 RepID=K4IH11_PSYTT|nr:hypothetical protein [Psychroflexus torquis]AFU69063.1 hypothetical protein P700755_002282 [Psychroflexus torquis ATCC 700755]
MPEADESNLESIYNKKTNIDFGFINQDKPVFKIDNQGFFTLAFKTSVKKTTSYYDNLVVEKRNTKKTNFYVLRYIPSEEWLSSNMDLSAYSGEIQVFDFQTGSLLGTTNVINSTPENKVITFTFTATACFICTAGICVYEWILECTEDSDAGFGGCENPFPDPPNLGDRDPTTRFRNNTYIT